MRKAVVLSQRCVLVALLACSGPAVQTQTQAQNALQQLSAPRPWWKRVPVDSSTNSTTAQGPVVSPQDAGGPRSAVLASWEGMRSDFTLEPPDPHGAAGPNGVIQTVNLRIEYWSKTGTPIWGPVQLSTFWGSVGNSGFNSDPRVLFDPATGHFYVTMQEMTATRSFLNIAVSKTSNPASAGPSDWFFYRIDDTETVGGADFWADYPGLGFDSQAIYYTHNMYDFTNFNFFNCQIAILDKAAFNSGTTNYSYVYTPQNFTAGFTLQPGTVTGSNSPGNVAYFGETPLIGSTTVRVWALTDPLGTPTLTSTSVTVPDNGGFVPNGAPQPGTGFTIDTLSPRTQGNAFWFNGAIWFCHTAGGTAGKSLVYYYKVDLNGYPSGTPTLGESGAIDGGAGEWTYQPSIGANAQGDVCMVFCQSSSSRFPTIMVTSRGAEATGFDSPAIVKASPGFYFGGRWGDYASTTADPVDNTFWVTHEWARTTGIVDWGTWWANILPKVSPNLVINTNSLDGGNGNGIVDFNECNQLTIVLTNTGSLGATNVQVSISTTTPGIVMGVRNSAYPDIPVGGSGTNATLFTISTAPSFVCGTPVVLSVLAKSDQGNITNTLVLKSGVVGAPVRFDNNSPAVVRDNDPVGTNSYVVVSNVTSAISKVTVALFLTHTFDSDMTISLISPDGVTNVLSAHEGGGGHNFGASCAPDTLRTTFDDDAPTGLGASSAPFVGTFKPDSPLSIYSGKSGTNVNGTWTLRIVDDVLIDSGVLNCWSLYVYTAQCTDGGGTCPGADLTLSMTDTPDPVFLGSNLVYTLTVTNLGPSPAKSTVVDQLLPGSVAFVSAVSSQGSCVNAGGHVICNLGTVPYLGVATINVTVLPTATGVITTTAHATASDTDPDPSNNSASAATHVNPPTADLSIGVLDAPDPALVGGTLTYAVSVTNNGPSTASFVTNVNTLPISAIVQSASGSQGFTTINGNVVTFSFGNITSGGRATGTIVVTPTAQGTIVANSTVSAAQADPITANNTVNTSTTVGPASDLAIVVTDAPDPVVVRSNWTYTISVTNLGPSVANSVVMNATLPSGVTVVSTNATQGTVLRSGNTVIANVPSLASGAGFTVTIVVNATNSGVYTLSATATSAASDPNAANSSASASTTVAPPNVSIVPAGATLTAESQSPANGAVDIGETVTVTLRLRNAGNIANTNVVATLLATNGVTPISGPQTYGLLLPSDVPKGNSFTFTASGSPGGTVSATLQLQDGAANLGVAVFNFTLPVTQTFSNTAAITIPDSGAASPYPSTITVSGITNLVGKVTATLSNLNHTFAPDVDVLLVGANGQKVILMSDAGNPNGVVNTTVTFDDSGATLPESGQILSTTYAPADYEPGDAFPGPAPVGPYGTALSAFTGNGANGTWKLFIVDDSTGDQGGVAGGWSLSLTTITPVNQVADLVLSGSASSNSALVGSSLIYTFTITNAGPDAATGVAFTNVVPAGAALVSASSSQGTTTTNGNTAVTVINSLNSGASAIVTVAAIPTAAGTLNNSATVAATENDLNPANNTASVSTTVNLPVTDVAVTQSGPTNAVLGSNVTFTITATNNGPQTALNVLVTDPLPTGLTFASANLVATNSGNTVIANLGNLAAGASASFTVTATAGSVGSFTNVATASTSSSDTNSANNSASVRLAVTAPAPSIVAAGATILSESRTPPNSAVDNGETVTVSLVLSNAGTADTGNLIATLQSGGGVTSPGSPQNYGHLLQGGAAVARNFTFTGNGTNGGVIIATLQLHDGADLGTATFTFNLPTTTTFANTNPIIIPDHGAATPYPSTIDVSGLSGLVSKVAVTLNGLTHGFPDDLDVLVVSPTGQKVVIMSDAGGGHKLNNVTLTFDDSAAAVLPDSGQIFSGSYQPTNYDAGDVFPSPAPSGATGGTLAFFNGASGNGTWSLYVVDDTTGDSGNIAGGWSLDITTVNTINPVADLAVTISDAPDPQYVGSAVIYSVTVTNRGPSSASSVVVTDTLPEGINYVSSTTSQGSVSTSGSLVTANVGTLSAGAGAAIGIRVSPSLGGDFVNTASAIASESDLDLLNNSASATTTVKTPAAPRFVGTGVAGGQFQATLIAEPGQTYAIQATTNVVSPSWTTLATPTLPALGTYKFTDTSAAGLGTRYYRAVRQVP